MSGCSAGRSIGASPIRIWRIRF